MFQLKVSLHLPLKQVTDRKPQRWQFAAVGVFLGVLFFPSLKQFWCFARGVLGWEGCAGSTLSLPTSAAGFSAAERLQHGFTHHRCFQHGLLGTLTCSPWGRMPGVPTSFPSGLGFCCTRRFSFIYFFPPGFLSSGRFLAISKVTPLLQTKSLLCPWLMVVEVL